MIPLLVLPAELYSTAELTGLKGPSWHHLRGLQFTLAAGLGRFCILPHWPSFFYGLDQLLYSVDLSVTEPRPKAEGARRLKVQSLRLAQHHFGHFY